MILKQSKNPSVFRSDKDLYSNACLNWCPDPLDLYVVGYEKAAEKLVENVTSSAQDQDILVYPIVFLYHHYLELRLKEIIREGGKLLSQTGEFHTHHTIVTLWRETKAIIGKIFEGEEETPDIGFVEHVIREIERHDPESYSFRYPTDKHGNKYLKGLKHINLRHLAETMDRVAKILEGVSTGISVYRDWQNDMLLEQRDIERCIG